MYFLRREIANRRGEISEGVGEDIILAGCSGRGLLRDGAETSRYIYDHCGKERTNSGKPGEPSLGIHKRVRGKFKAQGQL